MLIKCPECGHVVSDKAPVCPNCGITISGDDDNIIKETVESTKLHSSIHDNTYKDEVIGTPVYETSADKRKQYDNNDEENDSNEGNSSSGLTTILVSLVIAGVICAAGLYFYKDMMDRKNAEKAHKTEQKSNTRQDNTPKTNVTIVRDTIKAGLPQKEEEQDEEETKEETIETETALESKKAQESNEKHPLTQADKDSATKSLRRFLIAINSKDKAALSSYVTSRLTNFNGKSGATRIDVQQYMVDLYQADVKNLNWHINDVSEVTLHETADGKISHKIKSDCTLDIEREGGHYKPRYTISATIDSDGKISAMNISKK